MEQKRSLTGWAFLLPAALLIFVFCFYPMVQALILSFQKGTGSAVQPAGFANYVRILKDATFQQCLFNTIFYFVIQVPIMLILALILAQLLNVAVAGANRVGRRRIVQQCQKQMFDSDKFMALLPCLDEGHVQADFEFLGNHQFSSITHASGCWCSLAKAATSSTLVAAMSRG